MLTTYTTIFAEDSGWIVGWAQELPGAIVQERTTREARQSLKEVIQLIPEPRDDRDPDRACDRLREHYD